MKRAKKRKKPVGQWGKAAEKFVSTVDQATYAEFNYFSERNVLWRRFACKTPRLPHAQDRESKWSRTLFQPLLLNTFFGMNNKKVISTFTSIRDKFESSGTFPTLFILAGPPGSGKTALVHALLHEICACIGANKNSTDFIIEFDCEEIEIPQMWGKVNDFAKGTPSTRVPYKFVVLDGADNIPPTQQQMFKKIFKETEKNTKYILICRSLDKLTGHMLAKGPHYTTHLAVERDALATFLRILQKEKIGYNREGIEFLFKRAISKMNLRHCVDLMQETFLEYNFLSLENFERLLLKKMNKRLESTMPASRAVEPLERCKICTLIPPCKHITIHDIEAKADIRRKELPIYKGGMTCHFYLKHGYCREFNKFGHCSLNHPRKLHTIISAPNRCPQCSLVWPCHHCSFSVNRDALIDTIQRLEGRLHLLKQIAVDAPPIALTSHLVEDFPNYARLLKSLRKTVTLEKEVSLQKTIEWIDTTTSILRDEYIMKDKMIQVTFSGVLTSRLLDPPESFIKKESSSEEEEEADGDNDDDSDDSVQSGDDEKEIRSDGAGGSDVN